MSHTGLDNIPYPLLPNNVIPGAIVAAVCCSFFLAAAAFFITEASIEDFNLMHFATTNSNTMQTGMVIRKFRGEYIVRIGENDLPCSISSRLRKLLIYPLADPSSLHQIGRAHV